MAIEVSCGQCEGRLLVETPGVIVECPYCGVHLSIPDPDAGPEPIPQESIPDVQVPAVQVPAAAVATTDQSSTEAFSADIAQDSPAIQSLMDAAVRSDNVTAPSVVMEPVAEKADSQGQELSVLFGGGQNIPEEVNAAESSGWQSSPNLFLTGEPTDNLGQDATTNAESPSAIRFAQSFASQNIDPSYVTPEVPPMTDSSATDTPAEEALPVAAAPTMDMFLNASQQFQLGPAADDDLANPFAAATESPASPLEQDSVQATTEAIATATDSVAEALTSPAGTAASDSVPHQESFPDLAGVKEAAVAGAAAIAGAAAAAGSAALATDQVTRAIPESSGQQKTLSFLLMLVGSYASAVTLALLYLLLFGRSGGNQLESLPDLKPPSGKGKVSMLRIKPGDDVGPGHVLALGESQRFGNVRVTPIKVTRGPMKIDLLPGRNNFVLPQTGTLLKLWLKFENVSENQSFVPLDKELLFHRQFEGKSNEPYAYGFVIADSKRSQGKPLFRVYDLPKHEDYSLAGQTLDDDLSPGKSRVNYVPSDEKAADLKGPLVWRVHFRKGHNLSSNRGVTTLIDVRFDSADIKPEGTES